MESNLQKQNHSKVKAKSKKYISQNRFNPVFSLNSMINILQYSLAQKNDCY